MRDMIPYDIGDIAVNVYGQEVKIKDIANGEVVFEWCGQDSIDVLTCDEFDEHFRKVKGNSDANLYQM
jgi:hypothetical protein